MSLPCDKEKGPALTRFDNAGSVELFLKDR
jgi:hypothetical protein